MERRCRPLPLSPVWHILAWAMDGRTMQEIGRQLVRWYGRNRRSLPWRAQPNAYRVWVSEVMLQQTTVETVVPYFLRWMERFPDVQALAAASRREVLRLWEGMGYYQRARRLLQAARIVVEQHGGRVPTSRAELQELPGVGPYIGDAILSLAFGEDVVAVDANVRRVMMRLGGLRGTGTEAAVRRKVRCLASAGMPMGRSAEYNQALMDFGSAFCRPRRPACGECFLRDDCRAFELGAQEEIPRVLRRPIRRIQSAVAVFLCDGRAYLQRRPPDGMFGGMWEFPGGKLEDGETPEAAVVRECREELGAECSPERKLIELTHRYTVFEVRLHAFLCTPSAKLPVDEAHRWVALEELESYPMPSANRQVVEAILASAVGDDAAREA
ncbi:MAG: A/G-specific adenine glycosylase [Candidatus Brocadiaceae bacterium]|jgi:A/G-specific adenine glycosylase